MNEAFNILVVGPLGRSGGVASHTNQIVYYLERLNRRILFYNSSYEGQISRIIINIIKIYKRTIGLLLFLIIKRNSFDILHVQSSGRLAGFLDAITCSIYILFAKRKKFVVTFHYNNTQEFLNEYKRIMGFVLNRVDKFIVVSHHQEEALQNIYPRRSIIEVIPNGYDPRLFMPLDQSQCRKKLNLPEGARIVLNIANLEDYKGHTNLIKSMKMVLASNHNVMLYIVGKGSLYQELQLQIENSGCKDNIILAGGNKPPEEIPLWMNACDIFILPSLNESFGIVQIEAMACGKPVVATMNGGSEEIIINKKLGILVEAKDVEGLATAISKAINTEWNTEYIIDYAQQFAWDKIANRILGVYREIFFENSFEGL